MDEMNFMQEIESAIDFIKSTEATKDDLAQLAYFDSIPSQILDVLRVAAKAANGGATATNFTFQWQVGSNYQEDRFVKKGELISGDTISITGRFQYWEFCRKNPHDETIAFVRLRCNQLLELEKIQRFK